VSSEEHLARIVTLAVEKSIYIKVVNTFEFAQKILLKI